MPLLLAGAFGADIDPAGVLLRAKAKIAERSARLPRYTCMENVERKYYRPLGRALPAACSALMTQRPDPAVNMALRLSSSDRLRINVALVDNTEIYSWAGASRFGDNDSIDKLVPRGPIGTGVFAGLLDVIFLLDGQQFYYQTRPAGEGGGLIEYSFRVSAAGSHYRARVEDSWQPIAYSGTVTVDSRTDDVVRLTIDSAELPRSTGICQIREAVEFAPGEIAGQPLLLPSSVRQRFVSPSGGEVENAIQLTSCHEYAAESSISFGPPEPAPAANGGGTPAAQPVLPEGLHFTLDLTSPIDTDHAAAGDNFQARLVHPIHARKARISIPAGAIVQGRLLRVETLRTRPQRVRLALSLRTILVNGAGIAVRATRDWNSVMNRAGPYQTPPRILLPLPGEGASGVFEFSGSHVVVPEGFRSDWWSAAVETPK